MAGEGSVIGAGEGSVMGAGLPGVGEEGWSAGGSLGKDGGSRECWTGVGKSMSMAGKIYGNGCEDCVWECWQNGKTLSWKVTSRLVKKVPASISNNLYAFWLWG